MTFQLSPALVAAPVAVRAILCAEINAAADLAREEKAPATRRAYMRNPVQRGHRFQRKADSIPVITDSG